MPRDCRLLGSLVLALLLMGPVPTARQVPQSVLNLDANMAQLAAEAAARGPATPYPLLGETSRPIGAVYDYYLLGVAAARQERAAGREGDAAAIAAHPLWRSRNIVIVAYPIDCEGRPNQPLAIRWTMSRPLPMGPQPVGKPVRGNGAQAVLPGVGLPDDALVVTLRNLPMAGAVVEIDFANPVCRGAATTARLPIIISPSMALVTSFTANKLPDAHASLPSPTTVHIRTTLDAAGRARFPEVVSGPPELGPIALDLLNSRTFPPATTNGVPAPINMIVPVVFTTTGEHATPDRYSPAPLGGTTSTTTRTIVTGSPSRPTTPPPVVPPAPPGLIDSQLARLAIEVAQKGDPVPVPLDAAGPARHGVIFDRFLVAAVKARAAIASGQALDPTTAAPESVREDAVAVAFPLACDGRTIAPENIQLSAGGTRPGPIRETGAVLHGEALRRRLPGVNFPEGAMGKSFVSAPFSQGVEVRVTYADAPCGADAKALTLPIQWVRGTSIRRPAFARLPADTTLPSPMAVQLRGVVDLEGAYRFPTIADGPAELAVTAAALAAEWRFQPYRANGVPSPQGVTTSLTFTTTGSPEPDLRPGLDPRVPGTAEPPPALVTSSTGGRGGEFTTPDVAGLSERTSQCAIATTSTYGFNPAAPIKTGGGAVAGPARERGFLSLLRGPSGEGLRIIRRGSTMSPDGETLLDLYEITYAGLAAPVRLYLDEYHDGTLQAPQGFVCAAPIAIR